MRSHLRVHQSTSTVSPKVLLEPCLKSMVCEPSNHLPFTTSKRDEHYYRSRREESKQKNLDPKSMHSKRRSLSRHRPCALRFTITTSPHSGPNEAPTITARQPQLSR